MPSSPAHPQARRFRIRKGDIYALWAGQTVSMFGDEITAVALPTVALLLLNVSPLQFGLIGASSYLPYPVLGLLAGAWIDRVRRRIVLLIADLVRGAAIASIPIAIFTGKVSLAQLVMVGLITGTASVFFNSAYQAYLPHIVATDALNQANARLSISETTSQVAGPTMAGGLISLVGAGGAMLADAGSFLVSVVSLLFIRRPELRPERRRGSLVPEVREGLRLVIRNRLLLGLTLTSAVSNLGRGMALELAVFFAFRGLHLSPSLVGVIMAAGNAGPFLGSLVSQRFTTRVGIGPALLIGSVLKGLPWMFMPLALLGGSGIPVLVTVMVVSGFFIPISNVTTLTIRQTLVSPDMQGRVAATVRTVTRTVVPLATILGGALAQTGMRLLGPRVGLTAVLALGGLIWLSAGLLLPRRMLGRVHSVEDLASVGPASGAPARAAGAPHRPLLADVSLLWAEEPYRPRRVIGPAVLPGYEFDPGNYPRPGSSRAAGPPPGRPAASGFPANGNGVHPGTYPRPAFGPGPGSPPPGLPPRGRAPRGPEPARVGTDRSQFRPGASAPSAGRPVPGPPPPARPVPGPPPGRPAASGFPANGNGVHPGTYPRPAFPRPAFGPGPGSPPPGPPPPGPAVGEVRRERPGARPAATGRTARGKRETGRP